MCSRACSEPFPLIASDLHKCREQYTLTSGNAIGKTKALLLRRIGSRVAISSRPASKHFLEEIKTEDEGWGERMGERMGEHEQQKKGAPQELAVGSTTYVNTSALSRPIHTSSHPR